MFLAYLNDSFMKWTPKKKGTLVLGMEYTPQHNSHSKAHFLTVSGPAALSINQLQIPT